MLGIIPTSTIWAQQEKEKEQMHEHIAELRKEIIDLKKELAKVKQDTYLISGLYWAFDGSHPKSTTAKIGVADAVQRILDHLNLKLEYERGRESRTVLKPTHEKVSICQRVKDWLLNGDY